MSLDEANYICWGYWSFVRGQILVELVRDAFKKKVILSIDIEESNIVQYLLFHLDE